MADSAKTDVPDNANQGCPGTQAESAGKTSSCAGCPNQSACASGVARQPDPTAGLVAKRMADVKHKLLVLSGKGGVGKSTVSAQLAFSLAHRGYSVGLLDVDICGPSIPRMLGLSGQEVHQSATGWSPVFVDDNLGVMSIGFMLPGSDDAIIWRGPRKNGLIKQFLTDVEWGELDFLIIDTPPGTSDEHISIVQYLREAGVDGAVVVSTPQEVAMADVRKELNFCRKTKTPVVGVVENMGRSTIALGDLRFSGEDGSDATEAVLERIRSSCADLLKSKVALDMFPSHQGGVQAMASAFDMPFLGRVPLDPGLTQACEEGRAYAEDGTGPGAVALKEIVDGVVHQVGAGPPPDIEADE